MAIHPSAIIDSTATLEDGVEVQAFSIIEADVCIGAGTVVGPHCVVGAGTVLGKDNQLFSGAQVGISPQDLKQVKGAVGQTIIGDGNIFRETVTVSSSTVYANDDTKKVTRIGSNCLFMACSHVAHDCIVGDKVIMANGAVLAGHVTVEDMAILGGIVGVHQFCTVGRMAFVGGLARIAKDVLPYMICEGNPVKCFGPNAVGLERNGLDKAAVKRIRAMYKVLYRGTLNTSQALEKIEAEIEDSEEKQIILNFVRNSKRGIISK